LNAFLRHQIRELHTFKNGPFFWPTLYIYNKGTEVTHRYHQQQLKTYLFG